MSKECEVCGEERKHIPMDEVRENMQVTTDRETQVNIWTCKCGQRWEDRGVANNLLRLKRIKNAK